MGQLFAQPKQYSPPVASKASEQERLLKLMRQRMRLSEQKVEELLKGGLFQDFEKKFELLMQDFDKDGLDNFFKNEDFNTVLRGFNPHRGLAPGDFRWLNTPKERILILKMGQLKNNEIKIKIEKNTIKISGVISKKVESKTAHGSSTSLSNSSFEKSFPVPRDTVGSLAKIENKKGELLIRLPKKKQYQKNKKRPVPASKDDKVI